MKKLSILLLCAMLAIPSVNMSVSATESTEITVQSTDDGKEETTEKSFETLLNEAIVELNDYYITLEITEKEKKEADSALKTAASQLGYEYTPAQNAPKVGKFVNKSNPQLQSASGIENCVATAKAKLDKIKAGSSTATTPEQPETITTNSNIIVGGKEYDTTIANAGQSCTIAVPLVNLGDTNVTNVVITPVLSSEAAEWPFEISKTDYSQVCSVLEGENSGKDVVTRKCTFRWDLKTRSDAITGYTKLTFNITYNEADGTKNSVVLDYYVQVNGVTPKETNEDGKTSTPRVIVTGFTTTPEEVYAGDTFKLTLNLKNTSKQTAVSNMLFDIQGTQEGSDANNTYSAFLPTAGSSTIYVDRIPADSSKSITIELKSKADLAQKPYVVTVNMEYEDSGANSFTETASVSIPIKQEPKVDISSVTLMPESVEVGNEANVMFSIYNVGKTKLYNVNVKFEADSISGGDTFIGNMEPGATGNVDAYLTAQSATADDGTVKILITYEDEEGKENVLEESMNLYVSEPFYDDTFYDDPMMDEMEEESKGFPIWGILLLAVLAVVIVVVVLKAKKNKKAKQQEAEELEIIDLLDENPVLEPEKSRTKKMDTEEVLKNPEEKNDAEKAVKSSAEGIDIEEVELDDVDLPEIDITREK